MQARGEPLNTPGWHDPPPCWLSGKDASEGSNLIKAPVSHLD